MSAFLAILMPPVYQARAQETPGPDPISTERPTLGPSPDVIPTGSLQVENGANVSFQRSSYLADLPESLVRVSISHRYELRYQASDMMLQSGAPGRETADTQVSGKMLIGKPNQVVPRSAILALSLPTGGAAFTSGSYDPSLTVIWTQSFPHGYFLNQVAQATLTTLNDARRPVWAPSIAGGRALSSKLTVFAEYAPTVLTNSSFTYTMDGGAILTIKTTRQIDFRSGYTADSNGIHTLFGVGYSMRLDRYFHRL